ncbi:MAG TPA: hypothetical protein VM266_14470 [Solirubrobacteraceae bacterium]|nr:hypothetical protein [Solirubrobacteraceae bacterium]
MTWGFIWLMVVLKIPILMLLGLVWYAVKCVDDDAADDAPAEKVPRRPHPPRRRPPRRPRGPHGDAVPPSPPRVRTVARGRKVPRSG